MPESPNKLLGLTITFLSMVTANFVGVVLWFISGQKSLAGTANI